MGLLCPSPVRGAAQASLPATQPARPAQPGYVAPRRRTQPAIPPPSLGKNDFRSPFPAREGREQPDAALGTGRAGQGHRLDAGLCHGVAGRGPALAMLSPAGGWPRHWETSSVIFLLLLSCRAAVPPPAMCPSSPGTHPRGDPGSQHTPPRFPPPHPINLLLREKTRPFIFQGR